MIITVVSDPGRKSLRQGIERQVRFSTSQGSLKRSD